MDHPSTASQPRLFVLSRLATAFVSGALVMAHSWRGLGFRFDFDSEIVALSAFFGGAGLLFAAGVLLPWLGRGRWYALRGLSLVGLSSVSYWCAIAVADPGGPWAEPGPDTIDYVLASIVGAAIVLAGAKFILPLRFPLKLIAAAVPAAILGGLVFSLVEKTSSLETAAGYLAYAAWHTLMAAALLVSQAGEWRRNTRPA